MIRGIFSLAGLVMILLLAVRLMQGAISVEDMAIRGLVIVTCIGIIDKVIAPIVAAAISALSVGADDSPTAVGTTGDTSA